MSPEHFLKSIVEATYWCSKCGKPTRHRVDGGRRGPCFDCMAKLELEAKKPKHAPPAKQEEMF